MICLPVIADIDWAVANVSTVTGRTLPTYMG